MPQNITLIKTSNNKNYWKLNGKRWSGLAWKDGKMFRFNPDGTKALATKPAPSRTDMYNAIWEAENPRRKGVSRGKYKKFDTKVKYSPDNPLVSYSPNGNMHDVGAGINVENLLASSKESDRILAQKAAESGLTKQEVDRLINERIDENLRATNEALSWYTDYPDTISPQIKMGLMDVRYQVGNLGNFKNLLKAAATGKVGNINQPGTMQYENSVRVGEDGKKDLRRQKFRNKKFFHYEEGGPIQRFRQRKKREN